MQRPEALQNCLAGQEVQPASSWPASSGAAPPVPPIPPSSVLGRSMPQLQALTVDIKAMTHSADANGLNTSVATR